MGINDIPDDDFHEFGEDYNYEHWGPDNSYASFHRVPWDNNYRDVFYFDHTTNLNEYLDERPKLEDFDYSYLKPNQPLKVHHPFSAVSNYNYVRVYNSGVKTSIGAPDPGRFYYYFITGVQYLAANTTLVTLQLDVWQTYIRSVAFGRCYVEQGHIGLAADASIAHARRWLSVSEGLDVGAEMRSVGIRRFALSKGVVPGMVTDPVGSGDSSLGGVPPYIFVVSTVDLESDPGTVDDPNFNTATGTSFGGIPAGASLYCFQTAESFTDAMNALKDKPWITQGILAIKLMPSPGVGVLNDSDRVSIGGKLVYKLKTGRVQTTVVDIDSFIENMYNAGIDGRYINLKKFRVYPYSSLELSANNGQSLSLKRESFDGSRDLELAVNYHLSSNDARISIFPIAYNTGVDSRVEYSNVEENKDEYLFDYGDMSASAVHITGFPQTATVNNSSILYMANNANSLSYQRQSADWSQQKALSGAQAGFDNSSAAIDAGNALSQSQIGAAQNANSISQRYAGQRLGVNAAKDIFSGIAQGGVGGIPGMVTGGIAGVGSAVTAGIDHSISMNEQNANLANNVSTINRNSDITTNRDSSIRDTNKNYANFSAKGDYQNAIAGMNAKIQDAEMMPPSTVGQAGGDSYNIGQHYMGFDLRIRRIGGGAQRTVGEYWLRYGYAMNQFMRIPSDFKVMESMTYWKLKETYILDAECPEHFKQTIRGIMESGVTVWHDHDKFGLLDPAFQNVIDGYALD